MGIPDFQKWRETCTEMRAAKDAAFPVGSVVVVVNEKYCGSGVVAYDERCPLDQLAVRLCNGNVWWYPIADCGQHVGKLPSWVRRLFQSREVRRVQPTATLRASPSPVE